MTTHPLTLPPGFMPTTASDCMNLLPQHHTQYTCKYPHLLYDMHTLALTLPPGFMPTTAFDSAGGGFGPLPPAYRPPAEGPSAFLAATADTLSPTTNSYGCRARRQGLRV